MSSPFASVSVIIRLFLHAVAASLSLAVLGMLIFLTSKGNDKLPLLFVVVVILFLIDVTGALALLTSRDPVTRKQQPSTCCMIAFDIFAMLLIGGGIIIEFMSFMGNQSSSGEETPYYKSSDRILPSVFTLVGVGGIHFMLSIMECVDCCKAPKKRSRSRRLREEAEGRGESDIQISAVRVS